VQITLTEKKTKQKTQKQRLSTAGFGGHHPWLPGTKNLILDTVLALQLNCHYRLAIIKPDIRHPWFQSTAIKYLDFQCAYFQGRPSGTTFQYNFKMTRSHFS